MTTFPRLLLAALAFGAASPVAACSPAPPTPSRPWGFNFLGRALADSVRTGRGSIRPIGFFDRLTGRAVYGQRFAVERVGTPWQSQLPAGTKTVILVAWGIDGSCQPLYRKGSAVWIKPTMQGVYRGELRKKSQWINGEPTLDVVMAGPYTGPWNLRTRADSARRWLTPEEYLGFIETLPTYDSLQSDPLRATAALSRWATVHPELAAAEPVRWLVRVARDMVEGSRRK